jgi:hypothetical protein
MSTKSKRKADAELTATSFEAMSDAEKDQFIRKFESQTPEQRLAESRPLTARERKDWNAFRAKALKHRRAGRPKIGKGSAVVSVSIEKGLLKEVDAYAKANGLNRSELFIQGLRSVIGRKRAS